MGNLKMFVPLVLVFFVACAVQVSSTTPPTTTTPPPMPTLSPSPTFGPETMPTATFTPAATVTPGPTATPAASSSVDPTPTATPISQTAGNAVILTLEAPVSPQVTSGYEVPVEVRLDPQGRGISGVQFDLAYDPEQLQVRGFTPGEVLGADPLVVQKIGHQPGAALYAIARRGAASQPTPGGTVAIIRLQVGENVPPGTSVQLSLRRVKIANEHFQQLVGVSEASPLQLVISAP